MLLCRWLSFASLALLVASTAPEGARPAVGMRPQSEVQVSVPAPSRRNLQAIDVGKMTKRVADIVANIAKALTDLTGLVVILPVDITRQAFATSRGIVEDMKPALPPLFYELLNDPTYERTTQLLERSLQDVNAMVDALIDLTRDLFREPAYRVEREEHVEIGADGVERHTTRTTVSRDDEPSNPAFEDDSAMEDES